MRRLRLPGLFLAATQLALAGIEDSFPEIERIFERYHEQRGTPGLIFGIVANGQLVHAKAFGVRDRSSQDKVTPETVFRIASMTKSFTALAVLKLRDEGKLSLDDRVEKFISEFAAFQYPTRDAASITVRHLLTHGAGFPEDNPWGDRQLARSDAELTAWLKQGLPFSTSPDTAYEYSNYGFALLGRIVQKVSGVTYRQYLEKEILSPLGMSSSTLEPSAVPAGIRATGYKRVDGRYIEEQPLGHGSFGAMGGLLTSARDLARYVAYQLDAFPPRDDREAGPVRRSSRREMQRLWRSAAFGASRPSPTDSLRITSSGYGYGLGVSRDCEFDHIVGHGGGLPGFGSYMIWLPEYSVGVFAMSNLTYAGPGGVMGDVLRALKRTGALKKHLQPVSQYLTAARKDIVKLWEKWDEPLAHRIAADNLFLDIPAETRRKQMEEMRSELGACQSNSEIVPENLLRGRFRMNCEKGAADVVFTLAPTMPPRVQHLQFGMVKPPGAAMKAAIHGVAEGSDRAIRAVAGSSLDKRFAADREAVRAQYGACRSGEILGGDGVTFTRVRFDCNRGSLDVQVRLESGKLRSVGFIKPQAVTCAP